MVVIKLMGRITGKADEVGRMFAVYPSSWKNLRQKREAEARLIRAHSSHGTSFYSQIRYSDCETGIDVYVRKNKKGERWMTLHEALREYSPSAFPPSLSQ